MALVFRKEALDKFTKPEDLKDYVKVTNPRIVLGVVAAGIALLGLLVWGIFGSVPITTTVTGITKNGVLTCYSTNASGLKPGMEVIAGDSSGTIASISQTPLSCEEISNDYADYEMYFLDLDKFEYRISVNMSNPPTGIQSVTVIQERVSPLSFLL